MFARATAHFHQRNVDHGIDDLASVTLEMEHGIVGTLCIGRIGRAKHENDGEIKIHIVGTTGAMVINEPRPEVRVFYRGRTASDSPARRVGGDADWLLMENFAPRDRNERQHDPERARWPGHRGNGAGRHRLGSLRPPR